MAMLRNSFSLNTNIIPNSNLFVSKKKKKNLRKKRFKKNLIISLSKTY